jgi:hypothetical protein
LKRFEHNQSCGSFEKNYTPITFSQNHLSNMLNIKDSGGTTHLFKVTAVVAHTGTLNAGHYITVTPLGILDDTIITQDTSALNSLLKNGFIYLNDIKFDSYLYFLERAVLSISQPTNPSAPGINAPGLGRMPPVDIDAPQKRAAEIQASHPNPKQTQHVHQNPMPTSAMACQQKRVNAGDGIIDVSATLSAGELIFVEGDNLSLIPKKYMRRDNFLKHYLVNVATSMAQNKMIIEFKSQDQQPALKLAGSYQTIPHFLKRTDSPWIERLKIKCEHNRKHPRGRIYTPRTKVFGI